MANKSETARKLVDEAVALARSLSATPGAKHLICECAAGADAPARGLKAHAYLASRWGRWNEQSHAVPEITLPNGETLELAADSSLRYFFERYGTLTWIADHDTHGGDRLGGGKGPW